MEQLLTTQEAADALGTCKATVRRLVHSGRLTAYRIGRHMRFRRDDLLAALERVEKAERPHIETNTEKRQRDRETDEILRAHGIRS